MRTNLLSAWSLAACLSGPAASLPQEASQETGTEKVALRLNLRKGDRFDYRFVQDQSSNMKMGAGKMDSGLHTETDLAYVVEDVAGDGSTSVEIRFGAVRGTTRMLGTGETAFDSSKSEEPSDPLTRSLTALAGKSLRMRLSPNGRVLEVRGMSDVLKGLFEEDEPVAGVARKMLEETLSDDAMTKTMQACIAIFPEAPVGIGGSWTTDCTMPMPFLGLDISLRQISTLDRCDPGTATIESIGEMSMESKAVGETRHAGEKEEDGSAAMELARKFLGDLRFQSRGIRVTQSVSRKDGLPLRMVSEMNLEVSLPDPMSEEKDPARTQILQTVKTTLERVPLAEAGPTSRPAGR